MEQRRRAEGQDWSAAPLSERVRLNQFPANYICTPSYPPPTVRNRQLPPGLRTQLSDRVKH